MWWCVFLHLFGWLVGRVFVCVYVFIVRVFLLSLIIFPFLSSDFKITRPLCSCFLLFVLLRLGWRSCCYEVMNQYMCIDGSRGRDTITESPFGRNS